MTIYHIAEKYEWEKAKSHKEYFPREFAQEGFIHCSFADQFIKVLNRKFKGRNDLVLLEVDTTKLNCPLKIEQLPGADAAYPHIYGGLPIATIQAVHPLTPDANGLFSK